MTSKIELLKTCIAIENTISEVYDFFAQKFPEHKTFWKAMAAEERGHARQFVVASSLKGPDGLPASGAIAQEALESVWKTKKEALEKTDLRIEDAFRIAVSLEKSTVESFLERMITEEPDPELKRLFGTLLIDGRHHAELLHKHLSAFGQNG